MGWIDRTAGKRRLLFGVAGGDAHGGFPEEVTCGLRLEREELSLCRSGGRGAGQRPWHMQRS